MKVKIFYIWGSELEREREMNKWLREKPDIKFVEQSPDTESQSTIVTVWYEEGNNE